MKKYLWFMKYALKEQRQYKTNFFASMAVMIFNDACFAIIFLIFLWYFTDTGLTLGNFLILFSMSCMWYGVVHWLFFNIWSLSDAIEQWKLDYYLSFPVKPLYFLSTTKIWMADSWDIIFWLVCLMIYAFIFADAPATLVIMKWICVLMLWSIIALWLYIIVGSISFWLQKWSKVAELFNSTFVSFSQYPPEIYKENKIIYIFMCILLFPWVILPYEMMIWESTLLQRGLMVWFAILIPLLWVFVFNRWLKRYSSGNLVHQM